MKERTGVDIGPESELLPWGIRHSGWLLERFRVLDTGRSSFHTIKQRAYRGQVCQLGEMVWARDPRPDTQDAKLQVRWVSRVWLGKVLSSDDHIGPERMGARR